MDRKHRNIVYEKSLLKQGWQLSGLSVFNVLVGKIDRIILGVINPELLAVYYIGGVIPIKIRNTVKSLITVPLMHWAALNKKENLKKINQHILKFFLFGIAATVSIWIFSPWIIPAFYGESYRESVKIARGLSLVLPVAFSGEVILNVDIFQDRGALFQKSRYISQVLYLIALAVTVPRWGIRGVVACFVGRVYIMNGFFPWLYLRNQKYKVRNEKIIEENVK